MLLERDRELDLVDAQLAARSCVLAFTGGVGAGKTSVLTAAAELAKARGFRVLRGRGISEERGFEFGVLSQLFDSARISIDFAQPDELASYGPLALIIDDAHRADPASLRWCAELAGSVPRLPIALIFSVCAGDVGAEDPVVRDLVELSDISFPLYPLRTESIHELVRARGHDITSELVAHLKRLTAGNPLFICSILDEVAQFDARKISKDNLNAVKLDHLRGPLTARLGMQPAPVRQFAHVLATCDEPIDPSAVLGLCSMDLTALRAAERTLVKLGLFLDKEQRLVHRVVGEAAAELFTSAQRQTLRRRAAAVLDSLGYPAEQVAAHLLAAPATASQWATNVFRSAAASALEHHDVPEAITLLRHALLRSSHTPRDRAELLLELSDAERLTAPELAARRLMQAVSQAPQFVGKAEIMAHMPSPLLAELPHPAVVMMRRAVDVLSGNSAMAPDVLCRLRASLAGAGLGEFSLLEANLAALQRRQFDPHPESPAQRELAMVLMFSGNLRGAIDAETVAGVAWDVLGAYSGSDALTSASYPLALICLCLADDVEGVLPGLRSAIELAEDRALPVPRAILAVAHSAVLRAMGLIAEATEEATRAAGLISAVYGDTPPLLALPLITVAVSSGAAAGLVDELLSRFSAGNHSPPFAAALQLLRGRQLINEDNMEAALEAVLDAGGQLNRIGWRNTTLLPWRSMAAQLHHRLGQRAQGRELSTEQLRLAGDWGAPAGISRALRVQAMSEGNEGAVHMLTSAVEMDRKANDQAELSRVLIMLGARLHDMGDPKADEYAQEGARLAESVGDLPQGGSQLAEIGCESRGVLTAHERLVAALAVSGQTNKDIANSLDVSVRAIEKQLTRVYRKFGISGRAALVSLWKTDKPAQS